MEAVVQLFAEKVIRAGIIDADRASQIRRVCSDTSDIIEFGEALLKDCPDRLDQVQGLLDQTVDEYQQGGRATRNPFEATAMSSTPRATLPVKFNRTAASRIPVPESETPGEPVRSTRPEAASQDRPVAQEPEAPRGQPVTEPDRIPVEQPSARGSAAQEEKAPAQAAAPVSEQASGTPRDRRNRPPEAVVSAEGIEPGIPDFESLDPRNNEQIATALIGMLLKLGESDFSDLHLSGGSRPFGRKFGEVEYLAGQPIGEDLARAFGMALLSPDQIAYFADFQDYDFAIALDNGRRYRTNLMQHRDGLKITFRLVPAKVPSLEALGFGQHIETIKNLLAYHNGLILVTGPVGCGKTTTLAAMVDELNRTRTDHIICVEDPIEIVHRSDQCSVTQRAVGPHTKSFKSALKGALRQDPDIIVIGEMRDLETIEMAISASETGHLVIGTMHTSDAAMTLNRLLDVFPPAAQPQIRAMVAESLRGVICQRLLPGTKGHSVLACEILVKNMAVSALIRDGKQAGLGNIMETGKRDGMIQMDACVMQCYQSGAISAETARANIRNEIIRRNIV